ncbi:MAG: hypothetical protein RI924_1051 [Bacteroidota bacterium]|jgi:predicted alpha-1,2-mannosidase
MKRAFILFFIFFIHESAFAQKNKDYTQWVNPFIGTGGHGHTFPGPTLPFGMMQLGPDTRLSGWDGCSGYHYSDSVVYGFSHTHLSGTGVSDYGDILFMPSTGQPKFKNSEYASPFKKSKEKASAGYYETFLEKYQIKVALTTSLRAGFHQYTYPVGKEANIIVDLQHRDETTEAWVEVINEYEIRGFRRSRAWAENQPIYFHAKFNKPIKTYGIALNDVVQAGLRKAEGKNVKLFVQFDNPGKVLAKVGISAVSSEGALRNLEAEIPHFDFQKTLQAAKQAWNHELRKIEVESDDQDKLSIFYTALYHAFLSPNLFMDVDGQYFGIDKKIHRAEGFNNYTVFSLWDTYRTEHPLLNIIDRKRSKDFIQTFLKHHEHGGLLPIWELAGNETFCMIGNHSIPVILDAYRKGIDFDAEKAFEAMKSAVNRTQFGLDSYRKHGLVLADDEHESVSKTLEYAYDDWCVAQLAKALNKPSDYLEFSKRAQYWKNVFDEKTGFMRARANGGWWKPFDPTEVNNNFTEANSWQYTFYVPHEVSGLMDKMGGTEGFENKLDELFTTTAGLSGRGQVDITGLIGQYAHGNEPSHHMAYLYNFTNHPHKTAKYIQQIRAEQYRNAPDGLSGNEDCGQMSAWLVMSALGWYPLNPASNEYLFGTPWFKKSTIHLENGKSFVMEAPDYTDEAIYLQDIRLNNAPYRKSYLRFDDFKNGGHLLLKTGKVPAMEFMSSLEKPASAAEVEKLLSNPVIEAPSISFADKMEVTIHGPAKNAEVYYTLDGSEPTINSNKYLAPILIDQNTRVKAFAQMDGKRSFTSQAQFFKNPGDKKVKIKYPFMQSYTGGGSLALVDGIRGKDNFRLGNFWQGFQLTDFEAEIDLGKLSEVRSLALGCMQDTRSWIVYPTEISFYASQDGSNYQLVGSIQNTVPAEDYQVQIKDFELKTNVKTRFIKVLAKNFGDLPPWHLGHGEGGKAIIFVDELSIK